LAGESGHKHPSGEDPHRARLDPEHVPEIRKERHGRIQPPGNAPCRSAFQNGVTLCPVREEKELRVAARPGPVTDRVEERLRAGRPQRGIRVRTNESK
jgi:hypothetical protein